MRLVLTTQNSDHPEIIDQIHEPILEGRRISAKINSWATGISRERVGSIINVDLNMRKLSAKCVPKCLKADQKRQRCQSFEQLLEFFRRDRIDFLSRLVTMDETWLYQNNNQWSGDIAAHPAPKKCERKNPLEKFSPRFLGSRRHSPHWLSSKGLSYQRGVLLIAAGVIEGHFKGKTPREAHQVFIAQLCPGSRPHATKSCCPTWASNIWIS